MENRGGLTKGLAVAGTVIALMPLLAPVGFSLIRLVQTRHFIFDFLMPAELFPAAFIGGGLLIWAAVRARARIKHIIWSMVAAIALLVGSQVMAVVTGLASGETEAAGLPWILVIGLLVGYILALASLCIGGVLMLRDLFGRPVGTADSQ